MFGGAVGHRGEAPNGRGRRQRLEAEGRSLEALTDAEQREIEALGKRVERCDRQLDECLKDTPSCGKGPMPHVWGIRV